MILQTLAVLVLLGLSNAQDDPSTAAPPPDPSTAAPPPDPSTAAPDASTAAPVPSTAAPPATDAPSEAPTTAAATSAPPPKSLKVVCTHEQITAYLEHSFHPNLDLDKISLKDASCNLEVADNKYGDVNGTHVWLIAPFDSCGTTHNTTDDTITYENSIVAETRASAGSVLISREFQAEFPFKCTYPRSAIVSVASFSPREKVVYTRTAEFGNFTFMMDMYETDQYEKPYDSYPVEVDLNQNLYIEVKVVSNDSKLVVIPVRCYATPSSDPEDDKVYAFIQDGCNKDDTLVFDYEENAIQQFYMAAFRMLGESSGSTVHLHCDLNVCRKGDQDSRCAKGCDENNSRKRRGLYLDAVDSQTVSIGPVAAFKAPKEQASSARENAGISLTVIASIAGVLGVVVLILIVALVMLYKRFHAPQSLASVVYNKPPTTEEKNLLV